MSTTNEILAKEVQQHRMDFLALLGLAKRHVELASDLLDSYGRADLADEIRDSLEELEEAREAVENDFLRVTLLAAPAPPSGESA